jgi:hypothetical protein
LEACHTPLIGFSGELVVPKGVISLFTTFGTPPRHRTVPVSFMVVEAESPYNVIIGRPAIHELQAAVSSYHQKMKFPTLKGIGEVKGDQSMARKCYTSGTKGKSYKLAAAVELDSIDRQPIGVPIEKMKEVPLSKDVLEKFVKIGSLLSEAEQQELLSCLQKNKDVFA